ncbi:MAG: Flp pilus assembly complex ATPase component TadA [Elusimicrobia bacterium]|nr:Flp pilus assembly complex ATPase component TadA [Elusimicrobiota bacterium]
MSEERKPLILSVEDDDSMRMLIERILVNGGYDVRPFPDGGSALEWLETGRPDLILTDVMMPGTTGHEFCARLQADPELALIPVIFLTALDTAQDKAKALAAGAVGFLTKPLDKKALLGAVAKHARTKGRWDGLKEGLVAAAWAPDAERPRFATVQLAAASAGLPYLANINPETIRLGVLPAPFCRKNQVIAIEDARGPAFVLGDPFNRELLGLLGRYAEGAAVRVLVTDPANIAMLLKRPDKDRLRSRLGSDLEEVSIAEIAANILDSAVYERASDIHIEPKSDATVVRFRIDGDMREVYRLKTKTGLQLITRFKAQGRLDIAERRKPQDGSMEIEIDGRAFILRLATTCTPAGESLILRLLEPWAKAKPLEELGMSPQQVKHMVDFAHRNHGLIVIAGPTGSGKTTTIYSLLQHIDCRKRSLISVEDPVEYRIPSANQQQVDEKAGLTFEALLKSSLRQDPDILFLGEMRDPFSAKMAIDFSSTGHLTISSVHTTNATTAIFRLERIGITRGAMADSILGVIAQKLLKRLCPHCKTTGPATDEERAWFAPFTDDIPALIARPAGCLKCGGTGFFGREGIYEIVKFYPEISDMIRRDVPISQIRDFARQRGDILITDHAVEKVRALIFDARNVYENVLLEESEYRKAPKSGMGGATQPVGTAPAPAIAPKPRSKPAIIMDAGKATAKILVAEDDADTRGLIQRVLENQGYAVATAADGVEALALLAAGTFDLILSDVNMPNLDGLKLMEMKAQKRIDTPVIFFTAEEEGEAQALALGAEDYIKKPVSKDVIVARVRRALDRNKKF